MFFYLFIFEFVDVVGIKQYFFFCVIFFFKNVQVNFSICVCFIYIFSMYQYIVFKDWKIMKFRSYQGIRLLQSYQQILQYWREIRYLFGGVFFFGQIVGSFFMIFMFLCFFDNYRLNRKIKVFFVFTLVNLIIFIFQDGFFFVDFGMSFRRILQNLFILRLVYNI